MAPVENDLWINRTDGYFRYRIPALVETEGDSILAFCEGRKRTGGDDDEIDILVKTSRDGGVTWSDQRIVVSEGTETCGNPCPISDRTTGVIWLLFCQNNQRVFITSSDDDGESWPKPREITPEVKNPAWSFVGTGPCRGIQLHSGRLIAPSWCDETPGPVRWRPTVMGAVQSSYVIYSDDHGATWQRGDMLTRDASDECAVVEPEEGSLYMNARSRQGRLARASAWSRDGGVSWSEIAYCREMPEPSCQGSMVRCDVDNGELESVILAHLSDPSERRQLNLRLSRDGCRSWPVTKILTEGPAGYSDLAVARDGSILCLYENRDGLVLARCDVEWLQSGESAG
jgi:sialidase-1